MKIISFKPFLAAALLCLLPVQVLAQTCPDIQGFADLNCDFKLQITFVGDSIVTGFGDTENSNRGGYVLRLQQRFGEASIKSIAANGLKTTGLLELLADAFEKAKAPETLAILLESDVVILDVGRNDRLVPKPVRDAYRSLQLVGSRIRRGVGKLAGFTPLVVTSVMMVPGRANLARFVRKLNAIILKGDTPDRPADLRFDKVSPDNLSQDKLHPSSKGYQALFKVAESYLIEQLPAETRRAKRKNKLILSPADATAH